MHEQNMAGDVVFSLPWFAMEERIKEGRLQERHLANEVRISSE